MAFGKAQATARSPILVMCRSFVAVVPIVIQSSYDGKVPPPGTSSLKTATLMAAHHLPRAAPVP